MFVRSPHAFAAIRGIDAGAARALPGVLAVLTAADMERGRHRQRHPRQPGAERRRAGRAGSSGAGRRLRPPCRGGRGAGRRRERGDRARRRRACRGRLRAARSGDRCRGRRAAGRAATLARGAGQYRARLARVRRHRPRRGRDRFSPRRRMSRGSASSTSASSWRRWSRAARWRATTPRAAATSCPAPRRAPSCCGRTWRGAWALPPERIRVLSGDVGGAFGMRATGYPEYPALLVAARRTGRPVRWLASRSEGFLTDNQARDTIIEAALALDARRAVSRARYRRARQYGRLSDLARGVYRDREFRALPARHVRHRADRAAHPLPVHEHGADRTLSRRRPPRGELHARTAGRCGGAGLRHRPAGIAAAQPDPAGPDAVQDAGRHDL